MHFQESKGWKISVFLLKHHIYAALLLEAQCKHEISAHFHETFRTELKICGVIIRQKICIEEEEEIRLRLKATSSSKMSHPNIHRKRSTHKGQTQSEAAIVTVIIKSK